MRPTLQIIGKDEAVARVAGVHLMLVNNKVYFFADTTVNIDPTAEIVDTQDRPLMISSGQPVMEVIG